MYWGENPRKKADIGWRQRAKELYLRCFLKPSAGALGVGRLACDTYRDLVPPGRPVHNIPYAPDLDPLLNPSPETGEAAARLRSAWSVADPVVVLFSGSLTHRKAPDTLLEAFARVAQTHPNLCLQFAGDGPMAASLRAEVERHRLTDRVRFFGFVEGPDLWAAYLSSDLFVLPTRTHEGWGVVVQEAMAAGLPALLSTRVGCLTDVLAQGGAAAEFPASDVSALMSLLADVASDGQKLEMMSREAKSTARALDCYAAADAVLRVMGDSLGNAQEHPNARLRNRR